jgi:hypothetical protein
MTRTRWRWYVTSHFKRSHNLTMTSQVPLHFVCRFSFFLNFLPSLESHISKLLALLIRPYRRPRHHPPAKTPPLHNPTTPSLLPLHPPGIPPHSLIHRTSAPLNTSFPFLGHLNPSLLHRARHPVFFLLVAAAVQTTCVPTLMYTSLHDDVDLLTVGPAFYCLLEYVTEVFQRALRKPRQVRTQRDVQIFRVVR